MSYPKHQVVAGKDGKISRLGTMSHTIERRTGSGEILKQYAHQQAIVAALGQKALSGIDLPTLIEEALMLLTDGLRLEFGSIWEFFPSKNQLVIRAEVGWKKNYQPSTMEAKENYPAVSAVKFQAPVILKNLYEENRFVIPRVLAAHHIVSGICIAVRGSGVPCGVIGLYTDKLREFSQDEVYFLQSAASVLGMAIERKKTEEMLLKSTQRLQLSQSAGKISTFEWDITSGQIIWTPEVESFYEKSAGKPRNTYRLWLKSIYSQDRQRVDNEIKQALRERRSINVEFRLVHSEAGARWMLIKGEIFSDDKNRLRRVIGVSIDITDRKRVEDELLRSHNQLEIIIQNVADAILVQGGDGRLIYVNDVGAKMCGYSSTEELLQHSWDEILDNFGIFDESGHKLSLDKLPGWQTALGKNNRHVVVNLHNKLTKREYWVVVKSRPVYNQDGKVMMTVNIVGDVTKGKMVERERSLLAAIVESSDDAIFSKDLKGKITSWNTGAEKLYGYTPKEMIGKHISILFPPDRITEFTSIMEITRMGESIDHLETVRVRKNGSLIDVAVTASPLKDKNGTVVGVSAIDRDISLNKELERRKDAFIGMASHELKTPITSMKAFAQVIQKHLGGSRNKQCEIFLNKLDHQIDRLADLVNDLLDLSKIKAGNLEFRRELFDIDGLIRDTIYDVQNAYPSHTIELTGKVRQKIMGDRDRINQVLINLLTNAVKYSPGRDQVLVGVSSSDSRINISVQDFGIGIEKDHLEMVFDRFFRAEGPSEKTFPGLGIGLYVTAELVKRHGGHIWVESKKGIGSTFHVTLPIK